MYLSPWESRKDHQARITCNEAIADRKIRMEAHRTRMLQLEMDAEYAASIAKPIRSQPDVLEQVAEMLGNE